MLIRCGKKLNYTDDQVVWCISLPFEFVSTIWYSIKLNIRFSIYHKLSKMSNKISIRPLIKNIGTFENKSPAERFQNETLRPIIKLQHDLLVAFFENEVNRKKIDFTGLIPLKKKDIITSIFKNDTRFKAELRGIIIGLFAVSEYVTYLSMAADLNKRLNGMVQERLMSVEWL